MKLWLVAQWGNEEEGGDGHDTSCIVRANSMLEAVKIAEDIFNIEPSWNEGKANIVQLMGDDMQNNPVQRNVTVTFTAPALNLCNYPSWVRDIATNWEWVSSGVLGDYHV